MCPTQGDCRTRTRSKLDSSVGPRPHQSKTKSTFPEAKFQHKAARGHASTTNPGILLATKAPKASGWAGCAIWWAGSTRAKTISETKMPAAPSSEGAERTFHR